MANPYLDYLMQVFGNGLRPTLGPPMPTNAPQTNNTSPNAVPVTPEQTAARSRLGRVMPDLGSNQPLTYDRIAPILTDPGYPALGETHPSDPGMDRGFPVWWFIPMLAPKPPVPVNSGYVSPIAGAIAAGMPKPTPAGGASRGGFNQGT